ncbi:hypothetical protein E8E12_002593 [Didymella heteroderae]|uniref:Uncharacterized protein n=1 Tax=Didymella heteroderae TaxID=1769908 RepID=A0A9P4WNH6_9PLEO|nr:hypothetical protein E8E12_002593 [Didymella heteroderae]
MEAPPSSVFSSVFGRRKSKAIRNKPPPPSLLPPTSPIAENPSPRTPPPPNTTTPTTAPSPTQRSPPPPASHFGSPTTPQRHARSTTRHSIASSVGELGLQLRRSRSTSLRSATSSHKRHASTASTMHSASLSPEKVPPAAPISASRPTLSISTFARNKAKSSDNVKPDTGGLQHYDKAPLSALDKPKTPFSMAVPMPLRHPPTQSDVKQARQASNAGLAPAAPIPVPNGANPNIIFQHIHELASKRISTLDYLRKAHEGRIYWFNTLLFAKPDLSRLPSFTPRAQSRRATQYLLLGFSLPTILDLHAHSPGDYLRALNALLLEFETYQSMHPTDGSAPSLSRARIPQMFKRANLGGKGRRSSSATGDFPLLTPQSSFGSDSGLPGLLDGAGGNADDLNPGESYAYLQTPSLPFDPDFFSTFATLCDVLIDCYTKILAMLSTPESVAMAGGGAPSTVGDLFSKADARVRKIILAGVVREFEESCRIGVRTEVGGVGKVVLGGLM